MHGPAVTTDAHNLPAIVGFGREEAMGSIRTKAYVDIDGLQWRRPRARSSVMVDLGEDVAVVPGAEARKGEWCTTCRPACWIDLDDGGGPGGAPPGRVGRSEDLPVRAEGEAQDQTEIVDERIRQIQEQWQEWQSRADVTVREPSPRANPKGTPPRTPEHTRRPKQRRR